MRPIQTFYNGYMFRSRIEARWAVFFNALGVRYRYEEEGYDLGGGVWYLPDFWLPELDIFVEIKGKEPSREEERKGLLLATQSGKDVHICYNGIGHPNKNGTLITTCTAFKILINAGIGEERKLASISNPLRLTLRALRGLDVGIMLNQEKGILCHMVEGFNFYNPDDFLQQILFRHRQLMGLLGTLQQYNQELLSLLRPYPTGRYISLEPEGDGYSIGGQWTACKRCKKVGITDQGLIKTPEGFPDLRSCPDGDNNLKDIDRLNAAYTAARSARFEHRK